MYSLVNVRAWKPHVTERHGDKYSDEAEQNAPSLHFGQEENVDQLCWLGDDRKYDRNLIGLITGCLRFRPDQRPSLQELRTAIEQHITEHDLEPKDWQPAPVPDFDSLYSGQTPDHEAKRLYCQGEEYKVGSAPN